MKKQLPPKKLETNEVVRTIEKQYGLQIKENPEQKSGGVESAVWLVDSDKGRFYIKVYGLHEGSIEVVQDEVNLYRYLKENGIQVPKVITSLDNNEVTILDHDSIKFNVIVMKHEDLREAKPTNLTDDEIITLGKTIAKMNKAMKSYPPVDKSLSDRNVDRKLQIPSVDSTDIFTSSYNARFFTDEEKLWIERINANVANYLKDNSVERWEHLRNLFLEGYLSENNLTPDNLKAIKPMTLSHLIGASRHLNLISDKEKCDVDTRGIRRRYKLAEYLLHS